MHCGIPILNPADVQEYLDFGLLRLRALALFGQLDRDEVSDRHGRQRALGGGRSGAGERRDTERLRAARGPPHRLAELSARGREASLPAAAAGGAGLRARERARSGRLRRAPAPARDRHHGQGPLRRAPGARRARDRRGARARARALDLQGGDDLAARAGRRAPLRRRARGRARGRGEAAARSRSSSRGCSTTRRRGRGSRARRTSGARRSCPSDGELNPQAVELALRGWLERCVPELAASLAGRSDAFAAPPARGRARAAAELLLRLPAQHLDGGARRRASRSAGSAVTAWRCGCPIVTRSPSRRWEGRAPTGSAPRPSPSCGTSSRTSATAPTSIPVCSRSAPRSPPRCPSRTRSW